MKTMLVFVLVILALLVIPAVSAVPDIPNFESPGQVMAFGAHLLSGETVTICGEVVVPVFNGPGNSDGQLLRKWINDQLEICEVDYHMEGLSPMAHLLQPEGLLTYCTWECPPCVYICR